MQDRIKQMLLQAGWQQWQVDNVSPEDMARIGAYTRLVAEDCARVCDERIKPERIALLDAEGWTVAETNALATGVECAAQSIRARYAETKEP